MESYGNHGRNKTPEEESENRKKTPKNEKTVTKEDGSYLSSVEMMSNLVKNRIVSTLSVICTDVLCKTGSSGVFNGSRFVKYIRKI